MTEKRKNGPYQPANPLLIPTDCYLVRVAETERGLPAAFNITMKTLWPETASQRHVDFKPDRTRITYCAPTNRQIDTHMEALELVKEALADPIDWRIVWAVAHSAVFRERGPRSTEFKTPEDPWDAVGIKF